MENTLVHVNLSDIHCNIGVMTPEELMYNLYINVINKLRFNKKVNLVTIAGDLFHTPIKVKENPYLEMTNDFLDMLRSLSKINKFKIVVIGGTKSHEQGMMKRLEELHTTKKVVVDYFYDEIEDIRKKANSLVDSINYSGVTGVRAEINDLLTYIQDNEHKVKSEDMGDIVFVTDYLVEYINGNKILFMAEQYTKSYQEMLDKIPRDIDIMVYHGLIEGGLPIIEKRGDEREKMVTRYNRSHILMLDDILPKLKRYLVAGHIHNRVFLYDDGFRKIWYTGSPFSHNFADAGQSKGYDIITTTPTDLKVDFIKTEKDKVFTIIDITDDVNNKKMDDIVREMNSTSLANRLADIRFDINVDKLDVNKDTVIKVLKSNLAKNATIKIVKKEIKQHELDRRRDEANMVKNIADPIELISKIANIDKEKIEEYLNIVGG